MGTFRVLIAGVRHFTDYPALRAALDALLANCLPDVELLTAGGRGVPMLATGYAAERGLQVTALVPDFRRFAGHSCNVDRGVLDRLRERTEDVPEPGQPSLDATETIMTHPSRRRALSDIVSVALAAALLCGQLDASNDPEKGKEDEARREQNLKNMKRSAAQYTLTSSDTPKRIFKLQESALLRSSNPVSGTKDGATYLWTDHGRPQAILKLFTFGDEFFMHEWLSLSESAFSAERDGKAIWTPSEPGVTFRELPDAPKPAEAAADRLRQMKALSAKFSSTYTATHLDPKPFELRLLTQPLLRYDADDETRGDGALFGFVQSTAPVALLLLESRRTKDGPRWHYAFASMVSGPVTAKYDEKEVFSLEKNYARSDPKKPYLQLHRQPVPKE